MKNYFKTWKIHINKSMKTKQKIYLNKKYCKKVKKFRIQNYFKTYNKKIHIIKSLKMKANFLMLKMLGKKIWFCHKVKKFQNKFQEKLGKELEKLKNQQKKRIYNLIWLKIVKFFVTWFFNMFPPKEINIF